MITLEHKLINIVSLECSRTDHKHNLKHCKICMKDREKMTHKPQTSIN